METWAAILFATVIILSFFVFAPIALGLMEVQRRLKIEWKRSLYRAIAYPAYAIIVAVFVQTSHLDVGCFFRCLIYGFIILCESTWAAFLFEDWRKLKHRLED